MCKTNISIHHFTSGNTEHLTKQVRNEKILLFPAASYWWNPYRPVYDWLGQWLLQFTDQLMVPWNY